MLELRSERVRNTVCITGFREIPRYFARYHLSEVAELLLVPSAAIGGATSLPKLVVFVVQRALLGEDREKASFPARSGF